MSIIKGNAHFICIQGLDYRRESLARVLFLFWVGQNNSRFAKNTLQRVPIHGMEGQENDPKGHKSVIMASIRGFNTCFSFVFLQEFLFFNEPPTVYTQYRVSEGLDE